MKAAKEALDDGEDEAAYRILSNIADEVRLAN
jgi:hypothetical protein